MCHSCYPIACGLKVRNDAVRPVIVPLLNQHGDSVRAEFIQETD